jgi:hypothetical protein
MEHGITTMEMAQEIDIESGEVENAKGNISRKKWLILGITILIGLIGLTIVLCLVDLKPTSNHYEPVSEKILESKTLKWRFPEGDFDVCCSTIEDTQYYLKMCNEIFNPEKIKCVDVDKGSIILTLESTLIDFEKGIFNALFEVNHIGGQPTKEHRKYEPGENIEQKPKVPDSNPNDFKPGKNIEQKPKASDLDRNKAGEDSEINHELSELSPKDFEPDQDIERKLKLPYSNSNGYEAGENSKINHESDLSPIDYEAGEDSKINHESDLSPNDFEPDQYIKRKPEFIDSSLYDSEPGKNIEQNPEVSNSDATKAGENIEQTPKKPNSDPSNFKPYQDIITKPIEPDENTNNNY